MAKTFGNESPVIMLGRAVDLSEATIEDLVPRDDYVDAVKSTGYEFELNSRERDTATNVEAIRQAFERLRLGKFGLDEKVATALELIGKWGADPVSVPKITKDRASALFRTINQSFERRVR